MNDFVAKVSSPREYPIPPEYIQKQLSRAMTDHLIEIGRTQDLSGTAIRFDKRVEFDHMTRSDIYMLRARFIPIYEQVQIVKIKQDTKYIPNLKLTFWERFKFLFTGKLKKRGGK